MGNLGVSVGKQRLSKTLASAGVASRRACEDMIFAGRVRVNGKVERQPQAMVDLEVDRILVDKKPISEEKKVYFLLNKPAGFLCSARRGQSKYSKIVLDLFEDVEERIFTVGRLDKETQGLLIVTNDGEYAQKVIHPSANIHKEYIAKSNHEITDYHLKEMSKGITIEGTFVKPIRVQKVRKGTVKIVVAEGKKREVRELLHSVGLKVLELTRVRIGNLRLNRLPVGHWREMTKRELQLPFE